MLIDCPKCGFNQPEDLFCAQCGVNISKFTAKNSSGFKTWLNTHSSWILPSVLILGSVGYMLILKEQAQLKRSKLAQTSQIQKRELAIQNSSSLPQDPVPTDLKPINAELSAPHASSDSQDNESLKSLPSDSQGLADINARATLAEGGPQPSLLEKESLKAAAAIGSAKKLRIDYLEISKADLMKFIETHEKNREIVDLSDYSYGVIQTDAKRIKALPSAKVLKAESVPLQQAHSKLWNYSTRDMSEPDRFIGFRTLLATSELDPVKNSLRAQLEIQSDLRSMPSPNASNLKAFPADFELSSTNTFVMAGVLPHDGDAHLNSEAVKNFDSLKILGTPSFASGQSEFLILIYME